MIASKIRENQSTSSKVESEDTHTQWPDGLGAYSFHIQRVLRDSPGSAEPGDLKL